jgi:uncharacterized Zn finger protein (UPF0148 family)
MTKNYCRKCGNALTKAGAKFCTTCGATVDGAETDDITSQETADLPGKQTAQTVAATEVLPASKPPSNYSTEEMPQVGITARAEERSTEVIEVIAPAPVTQSPKKQKKPAKEKQPSVQQVGGQPGGQPGERKKLAMAAALGGVAVVALAAASFFFVNSRRAPEVQAGTQPAGQAEPSGSPQPAQQLNQQANQQPDQQSGAGANNQTQQQTRPQPIGEVKSPAVRNDESASNQQRQAAAKPTPATPQEQQAAGGPTSAQQSLIQGKTFLNQRRYQEALAEFDRVKNLDPSNKDVYYLIGSAYHGMNQLEQALEAYRQCTSGDYASVSRDAVKKIEKKVGKVNAR